MGVSLNAKRNAAMLGFCASSVLVIALSASTACSAEWAYGQYLYRWLFWGIERATCSVCDYRKFPSRVIDNRPPPFHFVPRPSTAMPTTIEYADGGVAKVFALDDFLKSTETTAFIVVKDDALLYEKYFNGFQRDSVCVSNSMAKSFTSALIGIAIDEGYIKGVNDSVTKYVPELADRGFEAITIKNLLTMESGIRFRKPHIFGREWGLPWDENIKAYFYPELRNLLTTQLRIDQPPGQSWVYTDYNPQLLGLILERTTHRNPSRYLEEKIWQPLGMEYPATWSIDSNQDGFEQMAVGLNARAIDFAKFGRLFLNGGRWNGQQIISRSWVLESTTEDPTDHLARAELISQFTELGGYYKYLWWGVSQGPGDYAFMANGYESQFIFVYPKRNVVIVRTGKNFGVPDYVWVQIFLHLANSLA